MNDDEERERKGGQAGRVCGCQLPVPGGILSGLNRIGSNECDVSCL